MMRSYLNICPLYLRLFWLSITLALMLSTDQVQAYTTFRRTWSSASTTYVKDSNFINQGPGWSGVADGAAADWNGTGLFSFAFSSSSSNHIKTQPVTCPQTPMPPLAFVSRGPFNEAYLSTYNITVNTCGQYPYYDGTQAPTLPANYYDLRSILRHEMGHVLGLGHSFSVSLMYGSIGTGIIRTVDQDARNGAGYLYTPNYSGVLPESAESSTAIALSGTYDGHADQVGYRSPGWELDTGFPKASNSTDSYNNQTNAKAWLHFFGNSITWRFTEASNRSTATVFIDGVDRGTFNLNETLTRWQMAKTWDFATSAFHLIEVRVNGSGSNGYTDVDNFVVDIPTVSNVILDNTHSQIQYIGNNWTHSAGWPSALNGTVSWSNTTTDAVTFTWKGTGVTYWYTKAPNRGYASISIDGEYYYLIDLYASSPLWTQTFPITGLPNGIHTIHVAVSGIKNQNSSNYFVDVDGMTAQ